MKSFICSLAIIPADVLMFMYDDDLMLSVKRLIWYHIVAMRTTLTLDESVADGLKILQQKNPDKSFKEIVNDLIKQGLQASGVNTARPEKFVVEPCGGAVHRPEYNFDNIGKLIETIEGDFHK